MEEAFHLIRAMEKNLIQVTNEHDSHAHELNTLIDAHEETIERTASEKVELQKSMLEMRNEVKNTIDERDGIVSHWKFEASRIVEENVQQNADAIQQNISVIEELEAEINSLRRSVDAQHMQIDALQAQLDTAESRAQHLAQQNQQYSNAAGNINNNLERALQERNLLADRLAFYELQLESIQNESTDTVHKLRNDIEAAERAIQKLRHEVVERENAAVGLREELRISREELEKARKKAKKIKRELDSSKRVDQEIAMNIKQEMENVVNEIQDEKSDLYSQLLSKESAFQEARIYAQQLAQEKEYWVGNMRTTGPVDSDVLLGSSDSRPRSPELDGLSLQVQQLKREKDLTVANLERKIAQVTEDYVDVEKRKRHGDLEIAELKARLQHIERGTVEARSKSQKEKKLQVFSNEVHHIKGDFEVLKNETANFAVESKNMLGQLENQLTGLILNSVQGGTTSIPKVSLII